MAMNVEFVLAIMRAAEACAAYDGRLDADGGSHGWGRRVAEAVAASDYAALCAVAVDASMAGFGADALLQDIVVAVNDLMKFH